MSQQASAHCDLVGVVSNDEYGDGLTIIKANNGTTDHLMKEMPVGTSITFEEIVHPAYGRVVIPVIRRGACPFDTHSLRILIPE